MNLKEYEAVRTRVGLLDAPFLGAVRVSGEDRVSFLHHLLTQDIQGLQPGSTAWAALVTPAGKLVSDMAVWAGAEAHRLLVPRARVDAVMQGLDHYLITEQVALEDQTASHAVMALLGPASLDLAKGVAGLKTAPCRLPNLPGCLVLAPAEQAQAIRQQLLAKGAARIGPDTWQALRIEAGIPCYGLDMDESNLLPETGLQARAVSGTKGCYVGQEIIARMDTFGSASRKLMGLVCEGLEIPQPGEAILSAGGGKEAEMVGAVTSACFSPALNKPIALGYIKRPQYEPGTRVTVLRGGQPIPATLTQLPFREVSDTFRVKSV